MEGLSILNPFDDLSAPTQNPSQDAFPSGSQNLSNITTLSVGSGTQVMRSDQSGFWLGAATFAAAPFSVSMSGVITSKSTVLGNLIQIDGGNARIIGNDGTTNRLVIGNV